MIIVRLAGGLGNQMFQYAAGLSLASRLQTSLSCDVQWFLQHSLHQGLELPRVFDLSIDTAEAADIQRVLGWFGVARVRNLVARPFFRPLLPNEWAMEPHFHYWSGFEKLQDNTYISGYWQSELYFGSRKREVRQAFNFRTPLSERNLALAAEIANVDSVSIHVRRGDYISDPSANTAQGMCGVDYYQRAIEFLSNSISAPHFYVFSDDIAWAKSALSSPYPTVFVDHNTGEDSYNDMRLMSICKHHIIANSSFSWWGAWLGATPSSITVAPARWFATDDMDTSDLTPKDWIRL